jgi:hypothetical protein
LQIIVFADESKGTRFSYQLGASQSDHPEQHAAAVTDPDCNQTETPFNCENLKKIEINCPQGDKRVHVIVRILFENITSPTEINITSH